MVNITRVADPRSLLGEDGPLYPYHNARQGRFAGVRSTLHLSQSDFTRFSSPINYSIVRVSGRQVTIGKCF